MQLMIRKRNPQVKTEDDDDDKDEGVVTRIKTFEEAQEVVWIIGWKVKHVTPKSTFQFFPLGPLHPPVSFLYSKFYPNSPFQVFHLHSGPPSQIFIKPHEIQNSINSDHFFHLNVPKSGPLHHQKSNTKHHKNILLNQKKNKHHN